MTDDINSSRINPFKHIPRKNKREWHLYWLCEDEDFRSELDSVIDLLPWTKRNTENKVEETMQQANRRYEEIRKQNNLTSSELHYIFGELNFEIPHHFKFQIIEENNDSII